MSNKKNIFGFQTTGSFEPVVLPSIRTEPPLNPSPSPRAPDPVPMFHGAQPPLPDSVYERIAALVPQDYASDGNYDEWLTDEWSENKAP